MKNKNIICMCGLTILNATLLFLNKKSKNVEEKNKVAKFKGYYNVLNCWMENKLKGKNVEDYFTKNGYKSIAIYGMGELGNRLYEELKLSNNVEVKYVIDKSEFSKYSELKIVDKDDILENVDAVIVTPIFAYEEIENDLSNKVCSPIVSLEEVIYDL